MKYIAALATIALGYATFNPTVRELFMSQPVWAFVIEGIVAYFACGFPVFLHHASSYVRKGTQERPDGTDIEGSILVWLIWPFCGISYVFDFVCKLLSPVTTVFVDMIAAYGKKRRKL